MTEEASRGHAQPKLWANSGEIKLKQRGKGNYVQHCLGVGPHLL